MTDEMDFSWLEREWKTGRAVQIGQELFADYKRYMNELGAAEANKMIESLDPTLVESEPEMAGQAAWMNVSSRAVISAFALYLARHEDDPREPPEPPA
jgi:hypothetical protein